MESKKDHRIPVEPITPGEYVQDMLESKGWTQDDLAEITGRSRVHINRLVSGKTSITADSAHELAKAFGTSAELWMNLQVSYELAKAAKENRDIERKAKLYEAFPVRDMVKRCWIEGSKDVFELESQLCKFVGISKIADPMPTALVARKSTEYGADTPAQISWFRRAQYLAPAVGARTYSDDRFDECIDALRPLTTHPAEARKVAGVLANFGIRLVFVETIAKAKIDGVAFWMNDTSPVIAMSLRFDRIDNFWFTLMHELVHVKYRDVPIVDTDLGKLDATLPPVEQRANTEACHYLIDREKMLSFILRTKPLYYQTKIVQFANTRGVHPGIVVGQLHGRDELDFKQLRKLLVGIRSEVVGTALTDGWGNAPPI